MEKINVYSKRYELAVKRSGVEPHPRIIKNIGIKDISKPIKKSKNFLKQKVKIKIIKFSKIIFFKLFFKNIRTTSVIKILSMLNKTEN
jgi:hypothetical protein